MKKTFIVVTVLLLTHHSQFFKWNIHEKHFLHTNLFPANVIYFFRIKKNNIVEEGWDFETIKIEFLWVMTMGLKQERKKKYIFMLVFFREIVNSCWSRCKFFITFMSWCLFLFLSCRLRWRRKGQESTLSTNFSHNHHKA